MAAARRGRKSRQLHLQHETLEQRLALAVTVIERPSFAQAGPVGPGGAPGQPITQPGYVTILGDKGEDVFIQQAATSPQSLLVADNPSFLNALFVQDIESYDRIVVTSGEDRTDEQVRQDNDAVYQFGGSVVRTRFVLPVNEPEDLPDGSVANPAILGTLQVRQSDGTITEWRIGKLNFVADVQIVSGSLDPADYPADYVIPAFSIVPVWNPIDDNRSILISDVLADRVSLTVSWRVPAAAGGPNLSPFPTEPVFESIYGSILPSSRLVSTFTLPNALGNGSNGLLSGTIVGTVDFDGGEFPFRTAGFDSDTLVFGGGAFSPGFETELIVPAASAAPEDFYHTVTGVVDRFRGVVTLRFAGAERAGGGGIGGGGGIAAERYLQDPGRVVLNASYAVSLQGNGVDGPAGSVTFFAGQDITRQVYVDLPTPGATVNVNSPLIMSPTLSDGDSTLRATNVNIAAKMLVNDRFDIGQSLMPTVESSNAVAFDEITENRFNREANRIRQANAVAEVVGGSVVRLYAPPGESGFGYDSDDPPTVTIQPPSAGGVAATAVAIIDSFGRISGYNITNPGSGYTLRPLVTVGPPVALAGAEAVIAGVDALGSISGITVTVQGYGYLTPPQVWIAPPPRETGGLQAKAHAVLDIVGRVVAVVMDDAGSGYDPTKPPVVEIRGPIPLGSVETVNLDSSIAARVFDIRIGDEVATTDIVRGSLNITPSGSIAGEIFAAKAAESVFILAQTADVNIEGTVWADRQSYLLQSRERDSELAPFRLATAARATGLETGLIRGQDVAVTLANDALTPGPIEAGGDNAIAFNTVSLRTDIDSLRIRASTRDGVERREPFPYELKVNELNSFSIDAVAASSFPIAISAQRNMLFSASLATANDVTLEAGENFTVSAPVSTTLGRINVIGDNVSVLNSLAVTAAAKDETRDDITLAAVAGVMTIGGALRANNNVNLVQRNRTEPLVSSYTNPIVLPIPNSATVTQSIVVSDTFAFDDIDIQVDITHPRVSDLTGTLIAPNGARYVLFNRPGLGAPAGTPNANMTGTIFDSEAGNPLTSGVAPYTGRFRPLDSLAPLYGDSVLGTWRLEISDVAPLQTGTLDNFQIFFTSQAGQQGGITGAARILGDRLSIDAEGYVGNPAVLPSNPQFYLQTDVNTLEARAGASLAIDEVTDLHVESIRSGGLVSLRARGVDPVAFGPAMVSALRGNLVDVSQLDVNAPNGSIDIENNAPKTITVGNSDALRRGGAVSMQAAGSVRIRSTGGASFGDVFVLDAPIAGQGARAVRGLVTSLPASSYQPGVPGVIASTLTANVNGTLSISGLPNLRVGDRLLVNLDAATGNSANGVYAVARLGGASARWVLTRAADSDTAAETPSNTFVRVTDGPFKGKVYQMTYAPTETVPFTRATLGVTETTLVTNIGSDDARDKTTFVVSTAGATTSAAGSLGKMLRLLQANDTSASENPEQVLDFAFSSQVLTPIRLTEQLPVITKKITIDGNVTYDPPGSPPVSRSRIYVDGSRIVRNRDGNAVTTSTVVNGFEFTGSAASGGAIANMTIAGFTKGAAVNVTNADVMLVNGLTLGTSELGLRVTNAYGVQVVGSSAGTTISGNTVTASTKAGVRLEGAATNTVLVGNTIGAGDRDNNVGVEVDTVGTNRIGVLPISPASAIPPVSMTRTSATSFTLPASYKTNDGSLFVGLGVRGTRITVTDGSPAARISALVTDPTTGVTTVTIVGGQVAASGSVTFGNFVETTANTAELTLPATVRADQLYVGQAVRGSANSGIASNARITAIAVDGAGIVTISLSTLLNTTGVTAVTFGAPPRNTVVGNLTGMVFANGRTTVTNTTVSTNTFDGIRITGGTNTIGSVAVRSEASNIIIGNGGFGIVAATTGARAAAQGIADVQTIKGNYLGVTPTDKSAARRNGKGNIGLRYGTSVVDQVYAGIGNKYVPNAITLVDAEGNEHYGTPLTPDPSTPTTPTPRPGTTGRRGVPPLPRRR